MMEMEEEGRGGRGIVGGRRKEGGWRRGGGTFCVDEGG